MRGFTINYSILSQRDLDFLEEIKAAGKDGYVTKRYFFDEDSQNEDGTLSAELQTKLILKERKHFSQWKLGQRHRAIKIEKETAEYNMNQQRQLLLHYIHTEKRNLFTRFNEEKRNNLGLREYNNWRTYWEHFWSQNTKYTKDLKSFSDDELTCWYDWPNGIYI